MTVETSQTINFRRSHLEVIVPPFLALQTLQSLSKRCQRPISTCVSNNLNPRNIFPRPVVSSTLARFWRRHKVMRSFDCIWVVTSRWTSSYPFGVSIQTIRSSWPDVYSPYFHAWRKLAYGLSHLDEVLDSEAADPDQKDVLDLQGVKHSS